MAAGESPGLLCVGCGGSVGPLCDRSVIRRGRSRPTTVSPAHDDEDPGVRLLRGSVFLPADSEDVAFRVLAAGNQPDFRTISEFRRLHLKALEELFRQVLRLALGAEPRKLGRG